MTQLALNVPLIAATFLLAVATCRREPRTQGRVASAGLFAGVLWMMGQMVFLHATLGANSGRRLAEGAALLVIVALIGGALHRRPGRPLLFAAPALLSFVGWSIQAVLAPGLSTFRGEVGLLALPSRHAAFVVAGTVAFLGTAAWTRGGGLARVLRLRLLLLGSGLALVLVAALVGARRTHGAVVLHVGGWDLQPLEPARWLLLASLASFLAMELGRPRRSLPRIGAAACLFALGVAAVALGLDETGPAGLLLVAACALFASASRALWLAVPPLLLLPCVGPVARWLGGPRILLRRLEESDSPFSVGGQIAEALWALSAGGWAGRAPGRVFGWRVPAVESDLALAGWVEYAGALGGVCVLALLGALLVSMLSVGRQASGAPGLFVVAVAVGLGLQVLSLVFATLGALPLTGVPLPFVSHGGASMVFCWSLAGIAYGLSEREHRAGLGSEAPPLGTSLIPNTRPVAGALLVGIAVAAALLLDRAVIHADELANRDFVSKARQERIRDAAGHQLVALRGEVHLVPGEESAVRTELASLLALGLVTHDVSGWTVDPGCCRVRNPRLIRDTAEVRGDIRDRHGVPVAETEPGDHHRRRYPAGASMSPVLGLKVPGLHEPRGAEWVFDDALAGRGSLTPLGSRPPRGGDVTLTVDSALQRVAWELLGSGPGGGLTPTGRGAVVLLDALSGEILVAASRPSVTPSAWEEAREESGRGTVDPAGWDALGRMRSSPRLSRAVEVRYPPGSTWKLLIAGAWLGEGFHGEHTVACRGRERVATDLPRCHRHSPSEVDLEEALAFSCNAWFGAAGQLLGDRVARWTERFGLRQPVDLAAGAGSVSWRPRSAGLPGDDPAPAWSEARRASRAAIGQDVVELSPLDVARLGAVFAARGLRATPRLVATTEETKPPRVVSEEVAETVHRAAVAVMRVGTGAGLPPLRWLGDGVVRVGGEGEPVEVAGKSGTADHSAGSPPHDWFVAWVRAGQPGVDRPLVVAVLVEEGGHQRSAGRIALEVLASALSALSAPQAPVAIVEVP